MLKTVDLFCGAGGLSYGFEATGQFEIIAAAENNKNARETYVANHKGQDDIEMIPDVRGYDFKALKERYGDIDVVIGGPPCQGFSNANRQKNHIISMNNSLVKEYFRAIREIRPKAFVMENVSMLSSETHRFYDSRNDHEEVVRLGVKMKPEELVISEENYDGVDCFYALKNHEEDIYGISDELFQHLNVLYKDRRSKENRLHKYIEKNGRVIIALIDAYFSGNRYEYQILRDIKEHLMGNDLAKYFDELEKFIKFQKSFRLLDELDENNIIYDLKQATTTGKTTATVNSYSVIEYVNNILGDTYVKKGDVLNSLWYGVPQERKRYIMLGIRSDIATVEKIKLPDGSGELPSIVTVGQAIMDLEGYEVSDGLTDRLIKYHPDDQLTDYEILMREGSSGIRNHLIPKTGRNALRRFKELKEGENFHKLSPWLKLNYADPGRTQNSIYLRLDRNKPSGTVINVRKSMWVHPTKDRAISIREAARLQSFPDRFVFKGTKNSQYQQVGNAVPPLMAKGIAELLLKYLHI